MPVYVGVRPPVGSAAAHPVTGSQKAKAAAGFLCLLSPHGVKPSLWGSLAGYGGAWLTGRAGESPAHPWSCQRAWPWGAGPACTPLREELCAEIVVGKPPPPFAELKICQAVCAGRYL